MGLRPARAALLARLSAALAAALPAAGLRAQEEPLAPVTPPLQERAPALTAPGLDRLLLGGQVRLRWEARDPQPPVRGASSRSDGSARLRVHLDAQVDEVLGGFVELQETVLSQGVPSGEFLHQGYLRASRLLDLASLQGGRFELSYGNQRMVSPLDWSMVGRAWDGALLQVRRGAWSADAFFTQPVAGQGAPLGPDQDFAGVYGQWDGEAAAVDLYAFHRREPGGALRDTTFGALLEGTLAGRLSWSVEGALQAGDHGALDAAGFAFAGRLDWHFGEGGPSVGVGYELASGDGDPADGDDGTFRRLFPFDHYYNGYADLVVWQNLEDLVLRAALPLGGGWSATGDLHLLRLVETADALYTGVGAAGAVASGTADDIGTELDLALRGRLGGRLELWTGAAFFAAGDAIRNGEDQLWFFAQATLPF